MSDRRRLSPLRAPRRACLLAVLYSPWLLAGHAPAAPATAGQYDEVIQRLSEFIESEVKAKGLPAVSIALVDNDELVWSAGFGPQSKDNSSRATSQTVYRVGSVSKLFNALALQKLAAEGKVDLDADVRKYLPEFAPENPFGKPITLRHLVAHQSGLVREPPRGSYFDPLPPPLDETIASLNPTTLVFEPGSRTKYSNAAVSVAGLVVQRVSGMPYAEYLRTAVLEPLQMESSSFLSNEEIAGRLPDAWMWTFHRTPFPAPTFPMGVLPAGNLYSTVEDLAQLMKAMFADGSLPDALGLSRDELHAMILRGSADPSTRPPYGVGFRLGQFKDRSTFGHGGAVYGFATQFIGLPEEKLGVVVAVAMDGGNGFSNRVAEHALDLMLARRAGEPLADLPTTTALDAGAARRLAGVYGCDGEHISIYEYGGRAYLTHGYSVGEIRQLDDQLIVDDVLAYGPELSWNGADGTIALKGKTWKRQAARRPPPCPGRWRGLLGEYGWDHNTLYVFEEEGRLWALIEWFYRYPLTEVADNVFAFPDSGLYHDERLVFDRDGEGEGAQVTLSGIVFPRRTETPSNRGRLPVKPVRPVESLLDDALRAEPPEDPASVLKPDLVELTEVDPTIKYDIRYATSRNILGAPLYNSPHAYLQRPAAEALHQASEALAEHGFGLLVYDAYRPWHVTQAIWEGMPPGYRSFLADPRQGSPQNRGCAVELALYRLETGRPAKMTSKYEDFSERSHPVHPGGDGRQRWRRRLLRNAMESAGFAAHPTVWWRFELRDSQRYPVINVSFEELTQSSISAPGNSD